MDKLSIDLRFLEYEEQEEIELILNSLQEKFTLSLDEDFKFNLKKYKLFGEYDEVDLLCAFKLEGGHLDYRLTLYNVGNEIQAWGIATVKKDFGHVLITKETFVEKLMDWIQPMDFDFEDDPEFSKHTFVVAKDKLKATLAMDRELRNNILNIERPDFLIEIINTKLIFGNKKKVSLESMISCIQFFNSLR